MRRFAIYATTAMKPGDLPIFAPVRAEGSRFLCEAVAADLRQRGIHCIIAVVVE